MPKSLTDKSSLWTFLHMRISRVWASMSGMIVCHCSLLCVHRCVLPHPSHTCGCSSVLRLLLHQVSCAPRHACAAWVRRVGIVIQILYDRTLRRVHDCHFFFVHLRDLHQLFSILTQIQYQTAWNVGARVLRMRGVSGNSLGHRFFSTAWVQNPALRPSSEQLLRPMNPPVCSQITRIHSPAYIVPRI